MAELTLKDESVIDIGQAVGERVQSIASTGTSIVPAGAGAVAPAAVAQPMNPFDSMMTVLSEIRDGIFSLVDKFSEGVSLQQQQIQAEEQAQDLNQVADTGPKDGVGDGEGGGGPGFITKAKDKVNELMQMGGFKGLLVKGGLIFGLLGIATMLKKYGAEIAKVLTPIVDGIKAFYSYVKDDIGVFFDDIFQSVKDTVTGIVNIFKGIFGDGENDGDLIRDGIAELLALPTKFLAAIGKLALGVLDAFLGVFGMNDPKPEWLTKMYEFLDELPAKVKQFFVDVMEFFTVTIPTKVQEAYDNITTWFTDTIKGIKDFFVQVKDFFVITVPTKISEVYTNITNWFGDIIGGIKGFFTDAFNYVTVEVPLKVAEVTKNIGDKFEEIKQDIIDFAMAPFKKIKELMKNLLVGILESVEGLPFIGDKAKALKEKILGESSGATETIQQTGGDASVAEQTYTDTANITVPTSEDGTVLDPKNGKMLKIRDEDAAKLMAGELTASGSGIYEPVYDDGGYFGKAFYKIKKVGVQSGQDFTVSGVGANSGADVNKTSAELASEQGNAMGYVNTGGNDNSVSTVTSVHNSYSEDTTSPDKNSREALYP